MASVTEIIEGLKRIVLFHKDRHDPNTGPDPLDCAAPSTNITPEQANAEGSADTFARSDHMHYIPSGAPSELASVQNAGEGTGAAFARTDHAHQIQHSIADNHLVTVDGTTNSPVNLDYAKWTTIGLEGKTYQQLVDDISGVIKATDVEVSELSTAYYDDVQDYINFFGDRTLITGGGITDNSNGTATVAAGKAWAKETDSDTAVGKFFDFSADNSVSLTDLITNYVYLDYNKTNGSATPQIVVSTDILTLGFKQDHIHIATIFRNGNTLHFHEEDAIGIGRMNIADMRLLEMHDADRASGLVTTATNPGSDLAISVSTGVIYEGLNRHTTIVDGSTWSYWYTPGDSGATWIEETSQTVLAQYYNDIDNSTGGTPGKFALGTGKYGVHWVYCDIDGANLFIVYGQGNYNANQAEEAAVPSVLPDIAVHYGVLIAKIINQEGTNTLTISYPWTHVFTSSLATDHGSLGGLGHDDHTQYTLKTLWGANTILKADVNNIPEALTVTEQTLIGRITSGEITALSIAQIKTLLGAGASSGLATLDGSTKVVEQPASITDHLDGSPDEDDATKAPTSEWAFDHDAKAATDSVQGHATAAQITKLDAIEAGATADQTLADIDVLLLASRSRARAYRGTTSTYIPNAQVVVIPLNAEDWDNLNEFDSSIKSGTDDRANGEGADHLIDDGNAQFAAGDVGKTVWNKTDNTYTTVTVFNGSGDVTLADAIFTVGETYEMFFSRFTATEEGYYAVSALIRYQTPVVAKRYFTILLKNGANHSVPNVHASATTTLRSVASDIIYLDVGDYFELAGYQDGGAAEQVYHGTAFTFMAIHKIG